MAAQRVHPLPTACPSSICHSPLRLAPSFSRFPWPRHRRRRLQIAAGSTSMKRLYSSVLIIPTGVGASIGGFAGDALPVARAMSSLCDNLITHPNVLNAAMLYWPIPNIQYVEGYALDCFAKGDWGLAPVHQNKIGLVLDSAIERDLQLRHLQVIDAARASLGLFIADHIVTDKPLGIEKWIEETGRSTGQLLHPDSLMRAVESMLNETNVNAIAVVARFPDDSIDDISDYRQGQGVDALAGVEAVISHMVVERFRIPCAHAPALSPLPLDPTVSPRSAAEEIGYTFLPSVLAGLSRAPQYVIKREDSNQLSHPRSLWVHDVDSVVVPINACGGVGTVAFSQAKHKPLLIAVEENETVLDDTPEKLQINVVRAANYWEALGIMAAHKAGVDPRSLRRFGVRHIGQCKNIAGVYSERTKIYV